MYLVAVGVGGDAHGVEAMGVEAIHLRMLDGHFLDQHRLAHQRIVICPGRLVALVMVDRDAVPLAIAGGLDHHAAMLFYERGESFRRDGGGVDPRAAEVALKEHVEEYLVAGYGGVAGLIVADLTDEAVAAKVGQVGIALLAALFVKAEEYVFAAAAARMFVSPAIVAHGRLCRRFAGVSAIFVKLPLVEVVDFVIPKSLRDLVDRLAAGALESGQIPDPPPTAHAFAPSARR